MEIVIGAVIAAIAGLGAAWLTNRATLHAQREEREAASKLERERWQREDDARREPAPSGALAGGHARGVRPVPAPR